MNSVTRVRSATHADMADIAAVFAHYVLHTTVTFETEPPTPAAWADKWQRLQRLGLPFLVMTGADELIGYAYLAPWRPQAAYRYTVEDSVYLAPHATGHGYGRQLLAELTHAATQTEVREVVAVIADTGTPASQRLHQRAGFNQAGRLAAVGFKHGHWIDTVLWQYHLKPASQTSR